MTRTINAIYEGGVLRPLDSLEGISEHAQVQVTVEWAAESRSQDVSNNSDPADGIFERAVETGISDLAFEHDHYASGSPKRQDA